MGPRSGRRWTAVAAGTAVLVGVPLAVRAWPVPDSDITAAALLGRVQAAQQHPYSGYVESRGTLQLPTADRFTDVGRLFGERTRMRVWWRSADAWRVDELTTTGETDLVHNDQGTTRWRYEQADATLSPDPKIRLPRAADLVPPAVAHLLIADADAGEVTRLPTRRVAGIDAPGLRVHPAAPQTSIDHVDVWADPVSGVVLRVDVVGKGERSVAFSTEFEDFSAATPAASRTAFVTPPGADFRFEPVLDIADAANQYAPVRPPDRVAGLTRSSDSVGAVGIYGTGVARLLAVPMRDREGQPLREQLLRTPGVRTTGTGTEAAIGPLGVLLTGRPGEGGWLVTGTVTAATLELAARDLLAGSTFVGDR
jgi:hypothetical protein